MAFSIHFTVDEQCDICRKVEQTSPMVVLYQSGKTSWGERDVNRIAMHRACWDKALAKADKKASAQVKSSCDRP